LIAGQELVVALSAEVGICADDAQVAGAVFPTVDDLFVAVAVDLLVIQKVFFGFRLLIQ
jgi:hypothetical protein